MTESGPLLRPDTGETVTPTVTPAPVEPSGWDQFTGWLDTIPGSSWAVALGCVFVFMLVSLPYARAQAYKAGQRMAGKRKDTKGTALLVAAMVPASLFWVAVLAGSFRGLVAFARDTLHWKDGWEYLVPLTLDGIAISFGFLAFRAVQSKRSPDRANSMVKGAALASALINYAHEANMAGGSKLGGAYLALLSVFGVMIFHEFLDQFVEGTGYIQRVNPKFGMRWLTWPSNTACAWIAWRNYPPTPLPKDAAEAQKAWWGSINHAVAHLNVVRRAKRIARYAADVETGRLAAPWWMSLTPWVRVRQLDTVLSARDAEKAEMDARLAQVVADFEAEKQRSAVTAEKLRQVLAEKVQAENQAAAALRQAEATRVDLEAQMARLREQSTTTVHRTESIADRRITVAQTELQQATTRLDQLEQQWIDANRKAAVLGQQLSAAQSETVSARLSAERAERDAAALRSALTEASEKHRTELAETVARLQAESAETVARIRAEMSTVNLSEYRNGEGRKPRAGQRGTLSAKTSGAPNRPRMTDEEALQALLRAHPEPEWQWSQPQIRDITSAGGERLQRLQNAIAEHHRRAAAENGRGGTSEGAESCTGEVAVNGSHRRPESPNGARGDLSDDDKEDSPDRPQYAQASA